MAPNSTPRTTRMSIAWLVGSYHAPVLARRWADCKALGDEQQGESAADWDRQVGDSSRQHRKFGDDLMPGRGAQAPAPDDHEHADEGHQRLAGEVDGALPNGRQR